VPPLLALTKLSPLATWGASILATVSPLGRLETTWRDVSGTLPISVTVKVKVTVSPTGA
jgi:hypothetical protein